MLEIYVTSTFFGGAVRVCLAEQGYRTDRVGVLIFGGCGGVCAWSCYGRYEAREEYICYGSKSRAEILYGVSGERQMAESLITRHYRESR